MSFLDALCRVITTFFGAGYAPKVPGTVGTFAALPLYLLLRKLSLSRYLLATALITIAGVASSSRMERCWGKDPGRVVIDEKNTPLPGLYAAGECACVSVHGANRLGASALMQGLADGYFVLPNTINDYLASHHEGQLRADDPAVVDAVAQTNARIKKLLSVKGSRTVDSFHKELGHIMWEYCGMERTEAGLIKAIGLIQKLREEFWQNVSVPGEPNHLNKNLEYAGRVADYLEFAELLAYDALHLALQESGDPGLIDGLTQDQRFFLGTAFAWSMEVRDEALRTQVETDFHAPEAVRGVQPGRNMDAFYEAFDIEPDEPMFLPPEDRIVIW